MAVRISNNLALQFAPGLNEVLVSEYQAQEELYFAQPVPIQRTLEMQASLISRALIEDQSPLLFNLPDQVACAGSGSAEWVLCPVPRDQREQKLGGFMDSLTVSDLSRHLKELEASKDRAVAACGRLLRHAVTRHLVHRQLPAAQSGNGRVPVPGYALEFFMPQWVAFDDQDNLLVNSVDEAKARLGAMQHYLTILKAAERLAPYIGVDEDFQRKQVGILAQLINQGHAMARHLNGVMIYTIRRRVAENSLNRGMSLSLPYFDDKGLEIRYLNFEVVPRGRIMFVPAFVVIAAKLKQMEVAHSTGFSFTTRAHLLAELESLERAFDDQNGTH